MDKDIYSFGFGKDLTRPLEKGQNGSFGNVYNDVTRGEAVSTNFQGGSLQGITTLESPVINSPTVTTPKMFSSRVSTSFESSARFTTSTGGSGAATFGASGLSLNTGTTLGSFAKVTMIIGGTGAQIFNNVAKFSCSFSVTTGAANGGFAVGLGSLTVSGSSLYESVDKFTIWRAAAGAGAGSWPISAIQGDGTTQSQGINAATLSNNDAVDILIEILSASEVAYRHRINGGAWTLTTLTTNVPALTTAMRTLTIGISNHATTSNSTVEVYGMSYQIYR